MQDSSGPKNRNTKKYSYILPGGKTITTTRSGFIEHLRSENKKKKPSGATRNKSPGRSKGKN